MKVRNVIGCGDEPEFSSLSTGIAATKNNSRHLEAQITSNQIREAIVIDFAFGSTWLDLYLSENRALHVFLEGGTVGWQLRNGIEGRTAIEEKDNLYLKWPHDPDPQCWDRLGLLKSVLNKPVKLLSASAAWLFLTVNDLPELMFSRVITVDDEQELLFYDPS